MKRILLTGFEPFGGASENPSQELLRAFRFPVSDPVSMPVGTLVLPNAIRRAPGLLAREIVRSPRDVVLHLGESRQAKEILVEQGAVNLLDTNIADNDGKSAHDEPVVKGAPSFLRSTMPVDAIVRAIRRAGVPVRKRHDGGTHVSNQIFYRTLHGGRVPEVGYIHVPPIQHRKGDPGMPFWQLVLAVSTAIDVLQGRRRTRGRARLPG
jgi:pyroglutamyl-peptidase